MTVRVGLCGVGREDSPCCPASDLPSGARGGGGPLGVPAEPCSLSVSFHTFVHTHGCAEMPRWPGNTRTHSLGSSPSA